MALYIGLMSGTSMDAIDAALVEIEDGRCKPLSFLEDPIPSELKQQIRDINGDTPLSDVAKMDAVLGGLFAEAVIKLLSQADKKHDDITAIGSHGQTVLHEPNAFPPHTVQIGDPNVIAAKTGITTVADFRRLDVALGGQGAPLAPLFHVEQFRTEHKRVVLNIGGFANITIIPANEDEPIIGFDTGPGNALMDDWIQHILRKPYDDCGLWAASGTVSESLLKGFLQEAFFSKPPPKSTGRDEFNLSWIQDKLEQSHAHLPEDVQATLLALSVETIATAIESYAVDSKDIIICGGGAYNGHLLARLRQRLPKIDIIPSSELKIDPTAVEAICFAWLAYRRLNRLPGNLPSVTFTKKPSILGGVYNIP